MPDQMSDEEFERLMGELSLSLAPPGTLYIVAVPISSFIGLTLATLTLLVLVQLPSPFMFAGIVVMFPSMPFFMGHEWAKRFYRMAAYVELCIHATLLLACIAAAKYAAIAVVLAGAITSWATIRLLSSLSLKRGFAVRNALRQKWSLNTPK